MSWVGICTVQFLASFRFAFGACCGDDVSSLLGSSPSNRAGSCDCCDCCAHSAAATMAATAAAILAAGGVDCTCHLSCTSQVSLAAKDQWQKDWCNRILWYFAVSVSCLKSETWLATDLLWQEDQGPPRVLNLELTQDLTSALHQSMSLPPRPLNVSPTPAASDKVRRWEESQLTTQGFPPEAGVLHSLTRLWVETPRLCLTVASHAQMKPQPQFNTWGPGHRTWQVHDCF